MIKRVVGFPGALHVNGGRGAEPYVSHGPNEGNFFGPERVPEGHDFVMGDRRANPEDSRGFGPVRREGPVGRVLLRLWPVG